MRSLDRRCSDLENAGADHIRVDHPGVDDVGADAQNADERNAEESRGTERQQAAHQETGKRQVARRPDAGATLPLRFFNWFGSLHDRRQQARMLGQLDEPALKDIGLTACDVDREIERLCRSLWRLWLNRP